MRIDKFLKNSRIIKRRTVAKEACEQGRISVNGKVAKPGTEVSIGDEIFDDGVDAGDYEQNQRFSMSVWTIKNVGHVLSGIEIPGVASEVLNALWKKCWKNRDPFYPECKLWHHMEYIKALKEIIG